MGRLGNVVTVSRSCLVASLAVLALGSSSYGCTISVFTDLADWESELNTWTLVEDFESVSPKDTALTSFTSNGNTYIGLGGVPFPNVWVSSAGYTNYGIPSSTDSSILTGNGDEDFVVVFGTPTTAVGFDTYLNKYGPATVTVHGSGGIIGAFDVSHDSTTVGFFGIISNEPIRTIRWTTAKGGIVNTGIDNIRIGHTPEPAAIVLWTIGTGFVSRFRKRRVL